MDHVVRLWLRAPFGSCILLRLRTFMHRAASGETKVKAADGDSPDGISAEEPD